MTEALMLLTPASTRDAFANSTVFMTLPRPGSASPGRTPQLGSHAAEGVDEQPAR
jgi:hypothetical protein